MESIFGLFFLVTLLFILLLFKLKGKSQRDPHPRLPPGPWQLPILGSIHHLILGSQLPHQRFQELSRSHGPLMHLKLGEVSTVVASSPEAAREIMKTHDAIFASRPLFPAVDVLTYGGKNIGFAPYGEYWRQLRKIAVMELLSTKRVLSFQFIREEEARRLIQSIMVSSQDGSLVNLSKMLVEMTNNMTTRASMGNRFEDLDGFLEAMFEAVELGAGFDLTDLFPSLSWASWLLNLVGRNKSRVKRCHLKLDLIMESVLHEHRESKKAAAQGGGEQIPEDLVDVLLRLQEEGELQFELTDDSIKALVLDMFAGGSETSSTTLAWVMSELMKNPAVMRKAQREVRDALRGKDKVTEADARELSYLQLVIKETLRLHPPLPLLLPRECLKKCELLGYEIREKTRVVVNAWAIGRDPRFWEDAMEFKPERFEGGEVDFKGSYFEFLPFGAGRRMCPGMQFGLAMIDLPLAQLLYYFDWELPAGIQPESLDMSESFGATAPRRSHLCLRATRNPLAVPGEGQSGRGQN